MPKRKRIEPILVNYVITEKQLKDIQQAARSANYFLSQVCDPVDEQSVNNIKYTENQLFKISIIINMLLKLK